MTTCGARSNNGPCVLPGGHNMGQADIPEQHQGHPMRPTNSPDREAFDLGWRAAMMTVTARQAPPIPDAVPRAADDA